MEFVIVPRLYNVRAIYERKPTSCSSSLSSHPRHFDESSFSLMTVRLCDRIYRIFKYVNQDNFSGLWCERNDDEYLRAFCVCNGLGATVVVAIVWFGLTPTGWTRRGLTPLVFFGGCRGPVCFATRVVLLNQQLLIWSTRYGSVRLLCNEFRYDTMSLVNNVNLLSVDRDPRIDISMY